MMYFIVAFAGLGMGVWITYVSLQRHKKGAAAMRVELEAMKVQIEQERAHAITTIKNERARIAAEDQRIEAEEATLESLRNDLQYNQRSLGERERQVAEQIQANGTLEARRDSILRAEQRLQIDAARLESEREQLAIEYKKFRTEQLDIGAYQEENALLKRDLRNLETTIRKTRLDHKALEERQAQLDERANELAERYLADVEKAVGAAINANNYASCKQRLTRAIEWCRGIGFDVPKAKEDALLAALKADYELAVRAALEREEQARIRAQIREEQAREREIQKELQALERERAAIQAALTRALADATNAHAGEVESLKARLAEAEARGVRAISQAQLTRAGHIYIISNIGTFGEGVYKIGMTRRLEPKDRIAELGDASVPFPFDIHMMISCSDAPTLENALHRHFHRARINRVNPRKEYFRVSLDEIKNFVEINHGEVKYIADAEALEYRQSQTISAEDQDYIEDVFDQAERAIGAADVED